MLSQALLVDDEWQQWAPVLRPAFEQAGWTLRASGTVRRAVELLKREEFDLVLLDLGFPAEGLSGSEAVSKLLGNSPPVPVIVLTAADTAADIRTAVECLRAGAWEYLTKANLDLDRLLQEAEKAARYAAILRQRCRLRQSFQRVVGGEPCFATFPEDGPAVEGGGRGSRRASSGGSAGASLSRDGTGSATCAFALALSGLRLRAAMTDEEAMKIQHQWALRLTPGLVTSGQTTVVELRYTATPTSQGGCTLETWLVGCAAAETTAEARCRAEELWMDMVALLSLRDSVCEFHPVIREAQLKTVLRPFAAEYAAEFLQSGRLIDLPQDNGPMGFRRRIRATKAEASSLTLPPALPGELCSLGDFCQMAVASRDPVALTLAIEPLRDAHRTTALLRKAQAALAGEESALEDGPDESDRKASNAERQRLRALQNALRNAREVRVVVTSTKPVPRAFLNAIGTSFFSHDPDYWQVREWSEAERSAAARPWGWHPPELPTEQFLTTYYKLEEAAKLMRLPAPGAARAAGVAVALETWTFVPQELPAAGVLLGKKQLNSGEVSIRLSREDRAKHVYAIGQTGTGKSTLLASAILSDIREGQGVGVLDPHGDLIDFLLPRIPKSREQDVVLFDPADTEHPVGLNLFESQEQREKEFAVQEAILMFYRLFDPNRRGIVGPQWEHWFRNASFTLMDHPTGGTLIEVPALFTHDGFREDRVNRVKDPLVKAFWEKQLAKTADFHKSEMYNYFISKFGRFMTNETMRNIIGQRRSRLRFRELMDGGKILLANLSRGKLGEMNSSLLGTLLVTRLFSAALGRADVPQEQRRDFCLYIDEFQLFTTETLSQIVSESRKYGLALCIAHQNLAQLDGRLLETLLGNVGTFIALRPGPNDVEKLLPYFRPQFTAEDLLRLPNRTACARMLLGDRPSAPFAFETILDTARPSQAAANRCRRQSRQQYARRKREVEREIEDRLTLAENRPHRARQREVTDDDIRERMGLPRLDGKKRRTSRSKKRGSDST